MAKKRIVDDQKVGDKSNAIVNLVDTAMKLTETKGSIELALDDRRNRVVNSKVLREPALVTKHAQRKAERKAQRAAKHRGQAKVAIFHYGYYDVAFKFFVEHVFGAKWLAIPPRTKHSIELGERYSSDSVCTPFKHMVGDYIQALELGADVIVQFGGICRLTYYGELQESILRDLGYDFMIFNISNFNGEIKEYFKAAKKINPNLSYPHAINMLVRTGKIVEDLDEVHDYYLAHAGLEQEKGAFDQVLSAYHQELSSAFDDRTITAAKRRAMSAFAQIPLNSSENALKIGTVGEFYTALDGDSNLRLEKKLLDMGVQLFREVNLTNRFLHYSEPSLRATCREYVRYDMGPTSTMTVAAAKSYAQQGFDGIIHIKSAGCTPEIDAMAVLQRLSADFHIPILYLSFDSQTSDAGLDTRLEAFYDMLAMKRAAHEEKK